MGSDLGEGLGEGLDGDLAEDLDLDEDLDIAEPFADMSNMSDPNGNVAQHRGDPESRQPPQVGRSGVREGWSLPIEPTQSQPVGRDRSRLAGPFR